MKLDRKGFTLTELLIAMAVVGVLVAILMPVIMNIMPNQKVLMAKRAHYTIESIVSNLLNDSACYPEETNKTGLDNGWGYADCDLWGVSKNIETVEEEGDVGTKFFTLFRDRLQLKAGALGNPDNNPMTLTTKDGMNWAIKSEDGGSFTIAIDVNGEDRGGGSDVATEPVASLKPSSTTCARDCDVAVFIVSNEGTVTPSGDWTTRAINVNTRINGD